MAMVTMGIDVGFGRVKAISNSGKRVAFRAAIGEYQPVKFKSGMGPSDDVSVAIEYEGRQIYVGEAALKQSTPEATIDPRRTVTFEGMALLMAAFSLLTPERIVESVNLVVGLPVKHYSRLKEEYIEAAKRTHTFFELSDGVKVRKNINVMDIKVLPQPFGTCFDQLLDDAGNIQDEAIANGNVGIIDNGYNTLDLLRVEGLEYIEPRSNSFSEMGIFAVCRALSEKFYQKFGVDISPEKIEPYLEKDIITIHGKDVSIKEIKAECYQAEAANVISRVKSTWPDYALLQRDILTGGGIINISTHLQEALGGGAVVVSDPMWGNVNGYRKFAKRVWK
jgi:plasmid segregation protein ParM